MAQARTNSQLVPDDIKGDTTESEETTSRAQSPAPSWSRQSRSTRAAPASSSAFLLPVTDTYGLAKGRRLSTPSLSERSENSHLYPRSGAHSRRSSLFAPLEAEQPGFFDLATYGRNQDARSESGDSSDDSNHLAPKTTNTRHRGSTSVSMESMGSSNSVPYAPPPPPPPSAIRMFLDRFSKRVIKRHIKFVLAIYMASLLTLIRPVGNVLGRSPFLANTTVVFMHPARTVGSQLEVTLFSTIGAVIAAGWIIPYQLLVTYYNGLYLTQGNTWGWTIEALLFFVGIWVMTTIKARYAKLTGTFLIFTISNIFAHGKTHGSTQFDIFVFLELIIPMMLGVLICLVVNILLWPETASERLGRSLHESLDTSRTLLNLSTRYFLLNHKAIALPQSVIENAQDEVRSAQKKLFSAYREARYEVTYSFTNPEDYKDVRTVISALMRHLGSMSLVVQNERLLMLGHPDRDDNDLHTENGEESDSGGGNADDEQTGDTASGESEHGGSATPRPLAARIKSKTSASELRRIRQLLLRAEHSTAAVGARVLQQQQQQQQQQSASRQALRTASQRGSIIAPSTLGGDHISPLERKDTPPFAGLSAPAIREAADSPEELTAIPRLDIEGRSASPPSVEELQQMQGEHTRQPFLSSQPHQSSKQFLSQSASCPNLQAIVGSGEAIVQNSELAPATRKNETNLEIRQKASNREGKSKNLPSEPVSRNHHRERSQHERDARIRSRDDADAKTEKRRAARQVMAESALRDIPPKEVAFGDRRVFISFLEIVREPLQRLSDSCSRVMVAMERDLVVGLDAEQDRLERLRKRSSRREAVVRKADASLKAEDDRQSSRRGRGSATSFQSQDQGSHPNELVDQPTVTEQRPTLWARLWARVKRDAVLTQSERDFTDAWRATGAGRDFRSDRSVESVHSRHGQRKNSWISRIPSSLRFHGYQDEDESMLPMNISYVEYLSHELEVFDRAETAGLQVFIATHPTLEVGPREEICLIFFFIFALREITQELLRLGRHVEKLEEQQKEEMVRKGQSRPKKQLWWPKVMGNFWHWIAWGSNSQAQASEGYAGMVMNSVKNLERSQPGLVAEEKSRVEAKASREVRLAAEKLAADRLAAENAARQEPAETNLHSLRRRVTALWDDPASRRTNSITASFWRRQPTQDLDCGVDESSLPQAEATTLSSAGPESTIPPHGPQAPGNMYNDTQQSIHPFSVGPQGDENVLDLCSASAVLEGRSEGAGMTGAHPPFDFADQIATSSEQPRMSVDTHDRDDNDRMTVGIDPIRQAESTELSPRVRETQIRHTMPELLRSSSHPQHGEEQLNDPSNSSSSAVAAPIADAEYRKVVGAVNQHPDDGGIRALKMSRDSRVPLVCLPVDEDPEADDDSESASSKGRTAGKKRKKRSREVRKTTSDVRGPAASNRLTDAEKKQQLPPSPPKTIFVNVSKPKTLRYRFWEFLQAFQSDEVRYGFKMALALTFVGLWAWLELTGMLRAADRGQWTMMTIMAVLSPTIGATFSVCAIRIGGTLVGTAWALITYLIYPDNPFVVSAMLSIIAFAGVFLILESKHPLMGVIMFLSFSSVTFAKYHRRTNETIYEICYKQVVNITLGIILSVLMNTFLWPVLARRELRKEIAQLIGRQGVLFAEMMNRFMLQDPEQVLGYERYGLQSRQENSEQVDEKAMYETETGLGEKTEVKIAAAAVDVREDLFGGSSGAGVGAIRALHDSGLEPGATAPTYDESAATEARQCQDDAASLCRSAALDADRIAFQHVEHQLQTRILKITQFLELSRSEPRLKETFPEKLYKQIVQCCQNILDRIVSMRMAAQLLSPEVRDLIIGPMNYYRRDLVGALLLYFSVISSSLASKTALPPFLPSARLARWRVVTSVREAIIARQAQTGEDHYTYIYYFAFSSALEEVIEELELLAILIKPIVGITLLTSYGSYGIPRNGEGYSAQSSVPPMIQISVPSTRPDSPTSASDTNDPSAMLFESGYWREAELGGNSSPRGKAEAESVWGVSQSVSGHGQEVHFDAEKTEADVHLSPRTKSSGSPAHNSPRAPSMSRVASSFESPSSASFTAPVVLMDGTPLRKRRSLRYKEAIATAQEASGIQVVEIPSPRASEHSPLQVVISPPPADAENTQARSSTASTAAHLKSPHDHTSSPL